jgi:predicted metal-dependent hydrolase
LIAPCRGRGADPHYLGFFDCFNGQRYFEAHEVLEEIWLPQRRGPNGDFYKGLIQLAGAFVHVQKKRRGPALALFQLAQSNLSRYPTRHQSLDVAKVLSLIVAWRGRLEGEINGDALLGPGNFPKLSLMEDASSTPAA